MSVNVSITSRMGFQGMNIITLSHIFGPFHPRSMTLYRSEYAITPEMGEYRDTIYLQMLESFRRYMEKEYPFGGTIKFNSRIDDEHLKPFIDREFNLYVDMKTQIDNLRMGGYL